MKRIAIELALTAALCCPAQNLVKNADFQKVSKKGKLVSWNYKGQSFTSVDSDQPGKTGAKAAMTKLTMPEGKKTVFSNMTQKITLGPGKYRLTFTAKVDGDGYANCSWRSFAEEKKAIKVQTYWNPVCAGSEWKTITHELEIPEGPAYIYLSATGRLNASKGHKEGSMYFADISLTPVEGGQAAEESK